MAADPTLARLVRRGADFAEFFEESFSSLLVHLEDSRVQKVLQGDESGLGLRVLSGDQTYYTYSQRLGAACGRALADELGLVIGARNARAKRHSVPARRLRPGNSPAMDSRPRSRPNSPPLVRRVDRLRPRRQPRDPAGDMRRPPAPPGRTHHQLARGKRARPPEHLGLDGAGGGRRRRGHPDRRRDRGRRRRARFLPSDTLERIGLAAARRAVQMLSARPAPGGRMPVVLSSEAGGTMIHEAVGHGLEADLAQEGFSVYSKRRGKRIASPLVSVVDDPTLCGVRGSYTVDDEGVPAERTLLVDRGVLRTYLFDRLSAAKDGRASNGHGRRQSYHQRPIPRMSNTMILRQTTQQRSSGRSSRASSSKRWAAGGSTPSTAIRVRGHRRLPHRGRRGRVPGARRDARRQRSRGPAADIRVGSDLGFALGTCGKDGQGVPVSDAQPTSASRSDSRRHRVP